MFNKIITPALIITAGLITASCTPSDADIEKIVIETIKKKPEIIVQALTDYQNQEQEKTKQLFWQDLLDVLRNKDSTATPETIKLNIDDQIFGTNDNKKFKINLKQIIQLMTNQTEIIVD